MGYQVILQPDGQLAVWNRSSEEWALADCTRDDVVAWFTAREAARTRESVRQLVAQVLGGQRVYARQQALTFAEADAKASPGRRYVDLRVLPAEPIESLVGTAEKLGALSAEKVPPWWPGDVVMAADRRLYVRAHPARDGGGRFPWSEGVSYAASPDDFTNVPAGSIGDGYVPRPLVLLIRHGKPVGGLVVNDEPEQWVKPQV